MLGKWLKTKKKHKRIEKMERDKKGRFLKGSSGNPKAQFCGGMAVDCQRNSVESRKEKTMLRDAIIHELTRKAKAGEPLTKVEAIVAKAVDGHVDGPVTFRDLVCLQELLGERHVKIDHHVGPLVISDAEARAIDKWAKR